MPDMDGPSLNAALLLDALVDLDAHLQAIWRYLRSHSEVTNVVSEWTLAHNMGPGPGQPHQAMDTLDYLPDQSGYRGIDTYVDAELPNRRGLVCYITFEWRIVGWRLHYYLQVYHADDQEDIRRFPDVETDRLDIVIGALQRAGKDLIEAVRVLDLKRI
jgi:hypothetical protein